MQSEFEIILLSIDDIKTNPTNPKIHTAEQVEQIKQSILDFGFNDPIAIDEDDFLIEGHGRLIAAKELGFSELPAIRITGLSEEQKAAYSLIHNQLTINTDFNYELLRSELEEIESFDMTKYSFEVYLDEYFDSDLIENYESKIIVKTKDENEADVIRDFLTENEYHFKEK